MKQFFGAMLMGCGVLVAGLSGLCLTMLLGATLLDPAATATGEQLAYLPAVLIFAGFPLVIGIAMFLGGRYAIRSAEADTRRENAPDDADVFR